ncbi:hypothetical protein [Nocardioides massiliensis]|uniref:DUF559 domain-containing protein n=1 Tax=Nocardioides massiliensis TaxID=1325935 RepID=A0ABT9NPA3_9ACTN|nr:hypothetical protein [Nocardioides massiliensis]MDP9822248.1 hypothetical protein [Nocardioides massiliensis]
MVEEHFVPRAPRPARLVRPVPVDPRGRDGPTRGAAQGPRWRRVGPAGYVPADVELTVEQRIAEEWCNLPGSRVTGWAACRLWGAAFADGETAEGDHLDVPLLLPRERSARRRSGRVVSRRIVPEAHHASRWRIATLTPGMAAVEATAAIGDERERIVFLEMMFAAGATLPEWVSTALDAAPVRGRTSVGQALATAGERSVSPNESRLRLVWTRDVGLAEPLVNQDLFDVHGRFLARVDLLDPVLGLVGEYDGAAHRSASRHHRDVAREADLRDAGLEVVRIVGGELTTEAGRAAAALQLRRGAQRASPRGVEARWSLTGGRRPWLTACDHLRARIPDNGIQDAGERP